MLLERVWQPRAHSGGTGQDPGEETPPTSQLEPAHGFFILEKRPCQWDADCLRLADLCLLGSDVGRCQGEERPWREFASTVSFNGTSRSIPIGSHHLMGPLEGNARAQRAPPGNSDVNSLGANPGLCFC